MAQRKPMLSPLVGLKGMLIGVANMVPGVSGGTIAVLTGLYDELMEAFGAFFSSEGGWRRNLLFLLPVIIGVVVGTVAFARLIGFLLAEYPLQTNYFFVGLIVGSLPFLCGRVSTRTLKTRPLICGGLFCLGLVAVLAMGLTEPPTRTEPLTDTSVRTMLIILAAALISSFAMVMPGLSGSFILLLLGMYTTMQTAFSSLNWVLIALFVVGNLIGIVLIARVVHWLLQHYHSFTYALIVGLVLGSIASLWQPISLDAEGMWSLLAAFLGVGGALVFGSGHRARQTPSS